MADSYKNDMQPFKFYHDSAPGSPADAKLPPASFGDAAHGDGSVGN